MAAFIRLLDSVPQGTQRQPSLWWLFRIGALIELCFLGLIVVTPLGGLAQSASPLVRVWPWLLVPARVLFPGTPLHIGLGKEHNKSAWPALMFSALLICAAVAATVAIWRCLRDQGSRPRHLALVLVGAAILGATLILLPSDPSDDIFSYIIYGRIAIIHHANPLVSVPSSFPHDPFLAYVYWRNVRSVYGPVWLLISGGLTRLAESLGGGLATYVLLFKLLGLASHLANIALIWAILSALAPRRRLLGTLLYGWSPLCLLEFCASAHNDSLMLTFLLAGVLCLTRRWEVPAMLAFGLSIATKYVPLALLPLYLVAVVRQELARRAAIPALASSHGAAATDTRLRTLPGRIRAVGGEGLAAGLVAAGWRLALVLAVVGVTALPYWAGPATLSAIIYSPPAQRLDNSWHEAISWPLRWVAQALFRLPDAVAKSVVETGLKLVTLLAFVALWLRELRRPRGLVTTLEAWAWVLLWYVVIASGWFWPWYVTWIVAVVALLPWTDLSVTTVLLATGMLILYAFRPLKSSPLYGYRSVLAFGPAVWYLARCAWERRRSHALAGVARSTRLTSVSGSPVSRGPLQATEEVNQTAGAPSSR
ncbi:MAG: hypothetical protein PVSMB4_13300 [Ktedonobacterales bacterium]